MYIPTRKKTRIVQRGFVIARSRGIFATRRRVRSLAAPLSLSLPLSFANLAWQGFARGPEPGRRPSPSCPFILFSRPRRARLLSQLNANEPVSSNYSN